MAISGRRRPELSKLTEKEVLEMEADVLQTPADPPVERAWLEEHRSKFQLQEKQMAALFKLNKVLRQDDQMKAAHADIQTIRKAIAALGDMLAALPKEVAPK
jgi:hypothetical protein